jgi:hypothetical protein
MRLVVQDALYCWAGNLALLGIRARAVWTVAILVGAG